MKLVSQTLFVNGVQRTYLAGAPGGGYGQGMVRLTGFNDLADRYGFEESVVNCD
ncbi:MAG TPA: hypothetical protein VFE36_04025 [Candidatus Baltobacteraceae bacterium]|nr:hypothetical protein [Candidatus Baltobacteraceae bacterium]